MYIYLEVVLVGTNSYGAFYDGPKFREPSVVSALRHRLSVAIGDHSIALKTLIFEILGTSSLSATEGL